MSKEKHYFLTDLPEQSSIVDISKIEKVQAYSQTQQKNFTSNEFKKKIKNQKPYFLHTKYEGISYNDEKLGFTSKTDRFYEPVKETFYNPGPGTYSLATSTFHPQNLSFNKKGYGVGFLSKASRFNTYSDYLSHFTPGPSDYSTENYFYKQSLVGNPLRGKKYSPDKNYGTVSSFKNTYSMKDNLSNNSLTFTGNNASNTTNSTDLFIGNPSKLRKELGQLEDEKDIRLYTEILKENLELVDNQKPTVNFNSKSIRFPQLINENPGPGSYDEYNPNTDKKKSKNKFNGTKGCSFFFRNHHPRQPNFIQKFNIQTKCDMNYKLKEKRGKISRNVGTEPLKRKVLGNTLKNIKICEDKYNNKKEGRNSKSYGPPNYKKYHTQSSDIIESYALVPESKDKNIKDNGNKLFGVPRWKENIYQFKAPGPAYYSPRLQQKYLSFNMNNGDFLISPGGPYNAQMITK